MSNLTSASGKYTKFGFIPDCYATCEDVADLQSIALTPSPKLDSIILDKANQDLKLSRSATSTLLIDDNGGGDATLQVATLEIDPTFTLTVDVGEPKISFDTGDFISYHRGTDEMHFHINGGPSDLILGDGFSRIREKLQFGDTTTYIERLTSGGNNRDVTFQMTTNDYWYWDDSVNELTMNIGSSPIINITTTGLEVDKINPITANSPVIVAGVDIQSIATFNILIGSGALSSLTTGDENTALGVNSLTSLETGSNNVAIGNGTSASQIGGTCTVAIGFNAMAVNTSSDNIGIGCSSMLKNTSGVNNTAVGRSGLRNNVTGNNNTSLGHNALYYSTGGNNTGLGARVLELVTTGSDNTSVGYDSGDTVTIGTNNTFLGSGADVIAAGATEQMALGYNAICDNNIGSIQLGQSAATTTGLLAYRAQTVMLESWKSSNTRAVYCDVNGSFRQGLGTTGDIIQASSITTGVTINSTVFTILTQTTTLGAELSTSFVVTNSEYTAGTGADVIQVTLYGYSGTYGGNGIPVINIEGALSTGSFNIQISNAHSNNALSGSLRIGVHIIKA